MSPSNRGAQYWQLEKSVLERNKYMYENKLAADVCFTVAKAGGTSEEVLAHSYVLLSSSPVFEAMLDPVWGAPREHKEKDNRIRVVDIPDLQVDALHEILRFIYYEEANYTETNAFSVLYGAKKYQLQSLENKCKQFIMDTIHNNNVADWLNLSQSIDEPDITQACLTHFLDNAEEIFKSDQLLEMSEEFMIKIVQDDKLNVQKEKQVFDACMKWALHQIKQDDDNQAASVDDDRMRAKLEQVLPHIRFPCIEDEVLFHIVRDCRILTREEELNIFQCMINPDKNGQFCGKPRRQFQQTASQPLDCVTVQRFTGYGPPSDDLPFEFGMTAEQMPTDNSFHHSFYFNCNMKMILTGVGLYINKRFKADYELKLTVLDNSNIVLGKRVEKDLHLRTSSSGVARVDFMQPVQILPGIWYRISATFTYAEKITHEKHFIGTGGRGTLHIPMHVKKTLHITFRDALLADLSKHTTGVSNHTTVKQGQIPLIFFQCADNTHW